LHFAQCSPQVLPNVVFADSKHVRDFEKRESLNLLQDENIPARRRKQKGPEHGQLERSTGTFAWYDVGIPARFLFLDWPTTMDHSLTGPIAIVRPRRNPFHRIPGSTKKCPQPLKSAARIRNVFRSDCHRPLARSALSLF